MRTARVPEKQVQADVVRLFRLAGCRVYSLSQPRATMQAEGLPDLWIFCPRTRAAWWFETKAADGRLSPYQTHFRELCAQTGVTHYVGGLDAARQALTDHGLVVGGESRCQSSSA